MIRHAIKGYQRKDFIQYLSHFPAAQEKSDCWKCNATSRCWVVHLEALICILNVENCSLKAFCKNDQRRGCFVMFVL